MARGPRSDDGENSTATSRRSLLKVLGVAGVLVGLSSFSSLPDEASRALDRGVHAGGGRIGGDDGSDEGDQVEPGAGDDGGTGGGDDQGTGTDDDGTDEDGDTEPASGYGAGGYGEGGYGQ